jgi:hypothetical protein
MQDYQVGIAGKGEVSSVIYLSKLNLQEQEWHPSLQVGAD